MCEWLLASVIVTIFEYDPGLLMVQLKHPDQPELIQRAFLYADFFDTCMAQPIETVE